MTKTAKKGRPKGATTTERPIAIVAASRCPVCGSTRRTKYTNRRELQLSGTHNGEPYSLVVWRACRCLDCGQCRTDKTHEQRPAT